MPSMPMLEHYSRLFETGGPDTPVGRKGRFFTRLCATTNPTRKKLGLEMGIRPGTVSDLSLELIRAGLVIEDRPKKNLQKGRPEIILRANGHKLVAIVCYFISQTVHCALVDLSGNKLYEISFEAAAEQVDPVAFASLINDLCQQAQGQIPLGSELVGMALSLPGIVDEVNSIWRYSVHWPKLRDIDLSHLDEMLGYPVMVLKNLNCELRARVSRHGQATTGGLILFHWGFGIGAAFVRGEDPFVSEHRGFGEVGHCCVDINSSAVCKCGMTGCVEAEAGLWALAPHLADADVSAKEWQFEQYLDDHSRLDIWQRPIELVALTLRNLCLIMAPDECIITGPFAQNSEIFGTLVDRFEALMPTSSLVVSNQRTILRAGRAGAKDEIIGAACSVFRSSLNQKLA